VITDSDHVGGSPASEVAFRSGCASADKPAYLTTGRTSGILSYVKAARCIPPLGKDGDADIGIATAKRTGSAGWRVIAAHRFPLTESR
jgi:hypothetical protein